MTGSIQVALVTGASSGIGLAFARLLAADGYTLFLVSRSEERLAEIRDELHDAHGAVVHHAAVDLTRPDGVETVANAVAAKGLHIDLLINNAGFGLLGQFREINRAEQLRLIRLNVEALVDLTHRFLQPMVERGRGGIINVASMAGFSPGPLMASYYASKAFVLSFSQGLSRELRGSGITVTALCPGPVRTRFQTRAGFPNERTSTLPPASARDVAEAALKGHRAGKQVVVPGLVNKLLAVVSRIAPRRAMTEVVFRVQSSRMEGRR